jgi:RNA polymerase sigma-70 factor (ECF subfamily)
MPTYLVPTRRFSDLTDDSLVQRARIGDPGAFEILVERYSAFLLRLISRIVRDEYLAHDILQYVFLQLYRSLPTLVSGGTLKPWLSQVARHRSIDELRRRRCLLFSEIEPFPEQGEYSFLSNITDTDRLPEEQVELRELRQKLFEAIETLPPHFRAVVWLRYGTQLNFREIGQELSIPAARAKTYFFRAKERLRVLLELEFEYERVMET